MRAATVLSLAALAALGCSSAHSTGVAGPAGEPLSQPPMPANDADLATVQALEARCRSGFSAETFQQAANALTEAQVAIGRLCTIELVANSPLQWRVSCGSDDFFALGRHTFGSATACSVRGVEGSNGFECLGIALRAMLPHTESVDVAAVGHVDFTRPSARLDCPELVAEGWGAPPWTERDRSLRGDAARDAANDRLAWCRAARAASAIATGIGRRDRGVRLVAVGASTSWMDPRYTRPDEELETPGACPEPYDPERDDAAGGACASARRVDVLIRMSARAENDTTGSQCDRSTDTPEGALYCLEECLASPSRQGGGGLDAGRPFVQPGRPGAPPERWHIGTSAEGLRVDLETVTRRLGY